MSGYRGGASLVCIVELMFVIMSVYRGNLVRLSSLDSLEIVEFLFVFMFVSMSVYRRVSRLASLGLPGTRLTCGVPVRVHVRNRVCLCGSPDLQVPTSVGE